MANGLPVTAGLLAQYDFNQGSGTTLTDIANGNNGTLGAGGASPSWIPQVRGFILRIPE